ncbi:Hypothetical protein CAP_0888 [Chondromyces apiculatus DSM 436]|uniref:Uncharacterized protein n=1 Tax=Chondromyces apiculatus DSM 436 TaxID=1192034 RepID=A0A017SUS3_9BACT|nr:Hypothetical protein CAP_0888 [Chondromyces apiculatus DSM 436]
MRCLPSLLRRVSRSASRGARSAGLAPPCVRFARSGQVVRCPSAPPLGRFRSEKPGRLCRQARWGARSLPRAPQKERVCSGSPSAKAGRSRLKWKPGRPEQGGRPLSGAGQASHHVPRWR